MQANLGSIHSNIAAKVATVEFGHPASNSFPRSLLEKLTAEINKLGVDENVSVIILRSSGHGAFCGGASFDELLAVSGQEEGLAFFSGFANLINAMRKCPKIIVGRVQGKAVGGGVGIAAACDYTFATVAAGVKLSELAIGIGPFVIEPVVSRKIGKSAMAEMTLAAHDWKSATWAHEKGLYAKVCPNVEELDMAVAELASKLASYNADALAEIKKIFWEGTDHWDELLMDRAAISGKLVLSEYTRKVLREFKK